MTIARLLVSPNIVIRDFGSQLGYWVFVRRQAAKLSELFENLRQQHMPEIAISDTLGATIRLKIQERRKDCEVAIVLGPRDVNATFREEIIECVCRCLLSLAMTGHSQTDRMDIDCKLEGWSSGPYSATLRGACVPRLTER